ncbi:1,2-phenylacetyl-CoA epoxidase subunit PaaD [Actinomadura chibensis]|uniref:Phenylacetate-CoA oxygenase subunit PaaJ n=1 Tax=Actinomadura chibensis TaxID=392828 RepID=A0A5D0NPE2_9ACTN|nr:1,2-phenylacetyl-CoA epoxidase subunit PaaD [Actinomadura chibensis]TYB46242.1 phenylacetate-CoA oxygenase subunit PaaJ [Actinomadura chibensis]
MVSARAVAETVTDPELPLLTLAELGVLRDVTERAGRVEVTITPTYTGCPALDAMRDDLRARLAEAGYTDVSVRTVLDPPWTSDWISESGRGKLAAAGVAPPGRAPRRASGGVSGGCGGSSPHEERRPIPLTLGPTRRVPCPRCGSADTVELSRFGATACKSLRRCEACREPFEHFKEI